MFWKRFIVGDQERVLVVKNGRFAGILEPGAHRVFEGPFEKVGVETYNIRQIVFQSVWADFLVKERPAIVEKFFTVVETRDSEVALVTIDGKLSMVIPPARRILYWRGAAEVAAEVIDIVKAPEVSKESLIALERLGRESLVMFVTVEESRVGLLFADGALSRILEPGKYGFWSPASAPRVEMIDMRRQTLNVAGQEILTKDKVSIRVNILAEYQVTDAVKAKQMVTDYVDRLYYALQLSVREALGRKTLEEILAEKTDAGDGVVDTVRAGMEAIGVRVGAIALKDVILPGDMREILNQVVTAEKQAQANLIRRREETAATRSLLNTAKLMEGNPILVRLKELETLEKLVEKVDRLTVSGGFEGLLDNLITMKVAGKG